MINDAVFNPSLHVSPFGQMELVEKGLFQVAVSGTQQSLRVLCQHRCVFETLENIRLKDNIGSWYDRVFIGPRSDHSLPMSVTHSLTHSLTH